MKRRGESGLVSVIIPVYNQPDLIVDCVNSVLAQAYRKFEIIIVDDGSSDRTRSVLRELVEQNAHLRVFQQPHQGSGAARETGRLNARGEYLQYLNSNDRLAPNKLAVQVSVLESAGELDIVCGTDSEVVASAEPVSNSRTGFLFPSLLNRRCWRTAAPLYRRRLTDKVGPWLASCGDETWDYEARIARLGAMIKWLDEPDGSPFTWHVPCEKMSRIEITQLLVDGARVQARIYQSARAYANDDDVPSKIDSADWRLFSQRAFDLSRYCALHQLTTQARAMLSLSIEANERKTPKHRLYIKLIGWFGWRRAAKLLK